MVLNNHDKKKSHILRTDKERVHITHISVSYIHRTSIYLRRRKAASGGAAVYAEGDAVVGNREQRGVKVLLARPALEREAFLCSGAWTRRNICQRGTGTILVLLHAPHTIKFGTLANGVPTEFKTFVKTG